MSRALRLAALPAFLIAAPASADPGHLAEQAGHSHWLALAALGGALVVVVVIAGGRIRRRKAALHG